MTVVGIDLGGTKLASALFSPDGELRYRDSVAIAGAGGAVAALIADRWQLARERARVLDGSEPAALGVVVPGIYRADRGTVWAPNVPGWEDFPLLDELRRHVGPDTPIVIDSDRAGYILGETWRGAAIGARDAIFLAVGTGIGAGILVDGRVLRGHGDIAGAIGWLALDRPFRHGYSACGCFEHHASGPGLAKAARERLAEDASYRGALRRIAPEALTAEHLFAALDDEDPIAVAVFDAAIEFWGMAVANLVSLFDPETIIFGGGVFGPGVRFLDRIRAEAARWAQPIAMPTVRVTASALGGDAGLFGAGRLALLAIDSGAAGRGVDPATTPAPFRA